MPILNNFAPYQSPLYTVRVWSLLLLFIWINIIPQDDLVAKTGFLAGIVLSKLAITRLKELVRGHRVIVKFVVMKPRAISTLTRNIQDTALLD